MKRMYLMMGVCCLVAWMAVGEDIGCVRGEVHLTGPLGARLEQMINRHITAADMEMLTSTFVFKTERRNWWQTEFWGKYMHAAVPFQVYGHDTALRQKLDAGIDVMLKSQEPCGYIGNYPDELRCNEGWDVWGMKYTLLGLMHYYDAYPETERGKASLAAARRLGDYLIAQLGPGGARGRKIRETGNWSGYASCSVLESIVWLYKRTQDKRYLDFAGEIVKQMTEDEAGPRLLDLALKGVPVAERNGYGQPTNEKRTYTMKHDRRKAYEMMSCYQGLLEYYSVTGRKDLMDATRKTAECIIAREINIAGGSASSEIWFNGAARQNLPYIHLQETCVTTTWMRFAETLLAMTGDTRYADELEKTFYNAYLASLHPSGDEFAAYTPLNGYRTHGHHHCYMHTNCCNANGPRGFLAFLRALLTAREDTAEMNFYVSGNEQVRLPKSGRHVRFETYARYPRDGYVRITNRTAAKEPFTLALRIPTWSAHTGIKVNGVAQKDVKSGMYYRMTRAWQVGDVVEVTFDMAVRVHENDHAIAFTRGPIALARDTRFADGPIDEVLRAGLIKVAQPPVFTPMRTPSDEIRMVFTASLPVGSHGENPEGAIWSDVHFCDFASAGNRWEPSNAYRVWLPIEYIPW